MQLNFLIRIICTSFIFLAVTAAGNKGNAQDNRLGLTHLVCEGTVNPVGMELQQPRFGWQLVSTAPGTYQAAYEIRTALSPANLRAGKELLWSSGKINSDQSVYVPYGGPAPVSRTKYYWQVRVWDNQQRRSEWSPVQYWETGLQQPADWTAKWIQATDITEGKVSSSPLFRREFTTAKKIKSARLYITGLGLYEAWINGSRIGEDYFTPGWTSYRTQVQYQTYDITANLRKGANAIGVIMGDGWYRGFLEFNNKRNIYGKEWSLRAQLEIVYEDNSKEIIGTDDTWGSTLNSPILSSEIYHGEYYDARKELAGWALPGFKTENWKPAREVAIQTNIVAPLGPPVKKHETFAPLRVFVTPKGETVVDFGQNLVGWVEWKIQLPKGDSLVVDHAEVLDKEGNFYTENLRRAKQHIVYIAKGEGVETYAPRFTFQGFRYIRVKGFKGDFTKDNCKAVALYSDMPATGTFLCSDSLLNQLQHNIQWGQKGNFLDVPTDCPQRDERLGWTGDAQVFFTTAAFNRDVSGFFLKWLRDLRADQHKNGNIPVVIPDVRDIKNAGSAGWGDVATIIPWNFYTLYGDRRMLETQYESMKAWVSYIGENSTNNIWNKGNHYGDWLFYSLTDDRDGKSALTDKILIAQSFYIYSVQNVIKAATELEKKEDVQKYTTLLQTIKQAFIQEFMTPNGRLVSGSQTAYVLALQFDILPEALRPQAAQRLVENIRSYKDHLTTGFLGTPYLCQVLSRFGYNDVAYSLLFQETYPSWLYPVKMGATTIWERWDGIKPDGSFQQSSMNSFNHYAYGAIGSWMYEHITGLQTESASPGYHRFTIAPQPGGRLTWANASLETGYGKIYSSWELKNGRLIVNVDIPCNTTALVVLPDAAPDRVDILKGKASLKQVAKTVTTELGSGSYSFSYPYVK